MKTRAALALAAFVCCVAFCALADAAADARKAIDAANKQWSAAFAKGDAKAIAALYAEDAELLPPSSGEVKGRAAIEETFAAFIKGGAKALELTTDEVQARGDLAFETGTWTLTMQPAGKEPIKGADSGKYLVIWKKTKGKWQFYRDTWNTSLPPAAPGGSGTPGTGTSGTGTAGTGSAGTGTAGTDTAGTDTAGTGSGTAGTGSAGTDTPAKAP